MRDELLTDLEQQVNVLVRRARRILTLRAAQVHPDLAATSYVVLTHVHRNGPLRASQIADHFDIDKGAVSRHVQALSDLGLVARTPDPEDRRASTIAVTQPARDRLADVLEGRRERLRASMQEWPDADLDQFVTLLGRYNSLLDWIDDAEIPAF